VFAEVLPKVGLRLLYDVSHNTCKIERHTIEGRSRELFVHRKGPHGAWVRDIRNCRLRFRALDNLSSSGETMGTESYVLVGTKQSEELSFSSAWHGAGRSMSRTQATERWQGRKLIDELAEKGVLIRTRSYRGVAEEAPGAYKDVSAVAEAAERVCLARQVARLVPVICIKA